jgi:2-polyprenyl-3-methyl-5-hydroxy-6-metoxy-1,4-benzoquinol methylase
VEQIKEYSNCPICNCAMFTDHLLVTDHMISKEQFKIVKCNECGFHFTNPIPTRNNIGSYYKSEEYVSHSSSTKGLINKAYAFVRGITLKRKVQLIQSITKGNEIVDIGSGTGHFVNALINSGFSVKGFEPDEDARNFAHTNFTIQLQELSGIHTLDDLSVDVITMWHVLEHVYDLKNDINEYVRVLKNGGKLVVAVPNMSSWDAKYYKSYWAAYDVPRHLYHFQEETIKKLMLQFNLECVSVLPMKFDSYYVSMLSEKYKSGSTLKGILNGFRSNLNASKGGFSSQIYVFEKK